jgi:hypothetical protein
MKILLLAFMVTFSMAAVSMAGDKACVTDQWYGALVLADMEQAIPLIYANESAKLNAMIAENRVGIFHRGTPVAIRERYVTPKGNNLVRIRKIGTDIEIWTHMAAVVCR